MKFLPSTLFAFLLSFLIAPNAQAHMLWVNSFESFVHPPGHATVSIGWGHALPIDDMTNSINARTVIKNFSLTDTTGKTIPLHLPKTERTKHFVQTDDVRILDADIACQKIAFNEKTRHGTYLIAATTEKSAYTRYVDTKGRTRLNLKPQNEIKDVQKVLFSVQYQAFAKSYVTIGEWKRPKPVGHGLEITPLTDLSNVKVGDMVEVDVRFLGKPLSYGPTGIEYITAFSPSFGQGKGFELFSYIANGKAQFEVQNVGQWVVNVFHNEPVTPDGPLKDLHGKVTSVNYGATLTFTVK